jgi:hypothetical protein
MGTTPQAAFETDRSGTERMLTPSIAGAVPIRASAVQFVGAFQQRVAAGLLMGHPHPRSNYRVISAGADELRVCAADWSTAINVGLNDIELRLPRAGSVHYQVRYWRWASYVLGLGGALGLVGLALLLTADVRGYITAHSTARLPGLSVNQNVLVVWAMVLFWGFAWPWLLIALHKRPLHRLIVRLVSEVDAAAGVR